MQKEDLTKSLTKPNEQSNIIQHPTIKTLYKGRPSKVVRSASKGKDDSIPKNNHKESNTVNIKKYSSYLSKGKDDLFRTKYAKTEEVEARSNIFQKKKSDNIMKYYTTDKKKKSVSLYEGRKDSEMQIRQAY